MARLLALALVLGVPGLSLARGRPALLLPPGLGRPDAIWVSGRVLEEKHGKHGPKAVRTARVLAGSNLVGAEVEVAFMGRSAKALSGHGGEFEVELRSAAGDSFPVGPQLATVRVADMVGAARVEVVSPDAPFLLVSDFDDTVAVTHVTSTKDMLATTFLEDAETHPAVQGMAELYRCFHAQGAPVAFVSGSPVQLAGRLGRFLEKNGFPPAALYLHNLGRKTMHGYKEPVLERLAERFPSMTFVLVGDTGERDPEVYAAYARAHPGRVAGIFLRRATPDPVPPARVAGAFLFGDPAQAAREAVARRLAEEGCVEGAR